MSTLNLNAEIEKYINAVIEIKNSINIIHGESYITNHKKTLLFSLLDMLSKGVYGNKYPVRTTMFEKFILEFCAWENAHRVSLQQLIHLLDKSEEGNHIRLKQFAKQELYKFPKNQPVSFRYDPTYEELRDLMPRGETTILGVELLSLRHVSLLWKLRNSLVHEARSKGASQLFDYKDPHYIHYNTVGKDDENNLIITTETWEMCHPVDFFNEMIDSALPKVKLYLEEHSINPYEFYDFDPLWLEVKKKSI